MNNPFHIPLIRLSIFTLLIASFVTVSAQDISDRELRNIIAFTKLYGYVRHFHPSDESAQADWNGIAVYGMEQVLDDKNDEELVKTLNKIMSAIGPTVLVHKKNDHFLSHPALDPDPSTDLKIVRWKHLGAGQIVIPDFPAPYTSERIYYPAPMKKLPKDVPNPKNCFHATLVPGIDCKVPLTLYANSSGTLPSAGSTLSFPRKEVHNYDCKDRVVRLADIAIIWNVIQHFYPYFPETDIDWESALIEGLEEAYKDQEHFEFMTVLRRLMALMEDGHAHVIHQEDPNTWQPPIKVTVIENQAVVVALGAGDSKGLAPGDVLLKIDGVDAKKLMSERMDISFGATEQFKRYYMTYQFLLNGPKNSDVNIEARKIDGSLSKVTLKRTAKASRMKEPRPKDIEEIKPDIYYINVSNLTDEEIEPHHEDIAKAKGVIYDFRGYPRLTPTPLLCHLIDKPIMSAYMLTPDVSNPDHKDFTFRTHRWTNLPPTKPKYQGKIVYLLDGRAVSYAESCMAIVEEYKLGEIIGEASAGTNGNVNAFRVPGGFTIMWTGMKVVKHDRSPHHGIGVLPTIPLKRTIRAVAEGKDEYLEKAIEIIQESE